MTTTDELRRRAMRAAVKIHERLLIPSHIDCLDQLPRSSWDRLRTTLWYLKKVDVRGWQAAARELLEDLDFQVPQLVRELEAFHKQLPLPLHDKQIAPPGQIVADLLALGGEFESVGIDLEEKTVTARTESITLEGLWLGPFAICLKWPQIGVRRAYEVIAEEPQHPADREDITHPHVQDKLLCEGDGAIPIRQALASGRLLDFFLIVRQTLETYNPASPYVSVKQWNGTSCHDCGYSMEDDEETTCERCSATVCSECSYCCQACSDSLCSECAGECAECGYRYCPDCLSIPAGTTRLLCPSCLKKGPASDDEDPSPGPAPAIHAVRLGQTAAAA